MSVCTSPGVSLRVCNAHSLLLVVVVVVVVVVVAVVVCLGV